MNPMLISQLMVKPLKEQVLDVLYQQEQPINASEVRNKVSSLASTGEVRELLEQLKDAGLAVKENQMYSITLEGVALVHDSQKGQAAPAAVALEKDHFVDVNKMVDHTESEVVETAQPTKSYKNRVHEMLCIIEQYPDITMGLIGRKMNRACSESFIPSYLKNGLVIVDLNAQGIKTYRLADGLSADAVFEWKTNAKDMHLDLLATTPKQKQALASNALQIAAKKTAPNVDFRVMYTSDGNLIMQGTDKGNIELRPEQVEVLVAYIEDLDLSHRLVVQVD